MNPKCEQAWKIEVLKIDLVQQHKNRTFQQLIGGLPLQLKHLVTNSYMDFFPFASLPWPLPSECCCSSLNKCWQGSRWTPLLTGEEPARLMQGSPFQPWDNCRFHQKGSFSLGRRGNAEVLLAGKSPYQRPAVQLQFVWRVLRRMCWSHQACIPWNVSWDSSSGQRTEIKELFPAIYSSPKYEKENVWRCFSSAGSSAEHFREVSTASGCDL